MTESIISNSDVTFHRNTTVSLSKCLFEGVSVTAKPGAVIDLINSAIDIPLVDFDIFINNSHSSINNYEQPELRKEEKVCHS